MKHANSQALAIGLAMGVTLALIVTLVVKFSSKEHLYSNVNGKNVGARAQRLASSRMNYEASTLNEKIATGNRFGIPYNPSYGQHRNWCRLRAKLGGCEAGKSEAVYAARGGKCPGACKNIAGQPGSF